MNSLAAIDVTTLPAGRNPALVYLASLPSDGSRRVQLAVLKTVLRVVSADEALDSLDPAAFPW